jgi:hypothetical protein
MSETYIASTGDFKQIIDGDLVNDMNYDIHYDGELLNAEIKHNEETFITQLDNETLLELLNLPSTNNNLIVRLQDDFPLKKTYTKKRKNKSSSKKDKKKDSKKKKQKRKTKKR